MTAAIGPVLGGWLVDHASWRWVFFINLPIAILMLSITFARVPESRNEQMRRTLDWSGALLATVALAGLTFALIEGHRPGITVATAACAGAVAFVGLIVVETHASAPMLPLKLFRSRTFASANLLTLFLYTPLNGLLFFFPLNLIQVQHYTATQAGAALLPLILILFLLSHWSGGLIGRFGARGPLTVGMSTLAVSPSTAAISLYFREGSSDKVYHAQIAPDGNDLYSVNFQYGRRGSTLQTGTKTAAPVALAQARKIFDKLVAEKKAKGYTEGESGVPYSGDELANRRFEFAPQLLNFIDEPAMLEYWSEMWV